MITFLLIVIIYELWNIRWWISNIADQFESAMRKTYPDDY